MELIKIAPQKITKKQRYHLPVCNLLEKARYGCRCEISTYETVNILPLKIENKPLKNNKIFNILFFKNGKSYFSYHFNQMLINFKYDLSFFTQINIENDVLTYETIFGNYKITELLISEYENI